MKPKASFILKGLIPFSFYVENNGSLFSQFKSSERQSVGLTATTSFTAVMKAAYAQGPSSLLEDAFRKDVEGTLASMLMAEFPVAIKQVLLYIKSTVENLGTVRAQKKLLATTLMTKLKYIYVYHTSYPSAQFSKNIGTAPLGTLMAILQDLVIKLQSFQETTDSEPAAENSQEGSDLFLEINQSSTVEANKEQVRGIVQFEQ